MNGAGQWLFNLMPAFYRLKDAQLAQSQNFLNAVETAQLQELQAKQLPLSVADAQQLEELMAKAARGPLQSLLMLIEEQLAIVAYDLNQLYDNQFIETCATWVIPYIGDLIGYQPVHGVAPAVASPRAEVAHTLSFRRRKGTVLVLEQLARDVTGWGAHAVEFFLRLADTQYMNHIRPHCFYAPDLRRWQPAEYMNSAFDATAHTVDVRRIAVERGRYNIQNIGIFLWSLNAYSVTMAPLTAVAASPQCFRFSTLGRDMPLFNNPISQGVTINSGAQPENVPDRLRRRVLCADIEPTVKNHDAATVYYGAGQSLALYVAGKLWPAWQIQVTDLSGEDGSWINLPVPAGWIAVDPILGRIALPAGASTAVQASYYYGFNGDMGGGEYSRSATFAASTEQAVVRVPHDYPTISAALAALPGDGVVEVTDSGVHSEPAGLNVTVAAEGSIELRGADGCRPTLVLGEAITVNGGTTSVFYLNGFVVTYAPPPPSGSPPAAAPLPPALLYAPDGGTNQLGTLSVSHCTLVPGWALTGQGDPAPAYAGQPALVVEAAGLQVVVTRSILGSLLVNGGATASLTDSIIDATDPTGVAYVAPVDAGSHAPQPGGSLTLTGCTVVGKVYASLLSLVSDSILWAWLSPADVAATPPVWRAPLWSLRKQQGCVRFSYLPAGSITPRTFECVEQTTNAPQPLFASLRYGDPAYLKLLPCTDDAIRRGADDGGEMGAYHFVLAPLRETDLRVRLQEYIPVGLEFGIFYET
jgi:hypothetical protein